jgi:hypothetical protein
MLNLFTNVNMTKSRRGTSNVLYLEVRRLSNWTGLDWRSLSFGMLDHAGSLASLRILLLHKRLLLQPSQFFFFDKGSFGLFFFQR